MARVVGRAAFSTHAPSEGRIGRSASRKMTAAPPPVASELVVAGTPPSFTRFRPMPAVTEQQGLSAPNSGTNVVVPQQTLSSSPQPDLLFENFDRLSRAAAAAAAADTRDPPPTSSNNLPKGSPSVTATATAGGGHYWVLPPECVALDGEWVQLRAVRIGTFM